MSCWVAPSIAAELWGISLEQVIAKAKAGEITSSTEHGFFVIGLTPSLEAQQNVASPSTFTPIDDPVTATKLEALPGEEPDDSRDRPTPSPDPADEESAEIEDWREVRRKMGRMRIPPRPLNPQSQMHAHAA